MDNVQQSDSGRPSRRAVLRGGALVGGTARAALAGGAAEAVRASATTPNTQMSPHFPDGRLRETRVLWQASTTARRVALTFDDGPMPD